MIKEYHILVHGLVQGVCFRALVKERAQHYSLYGYVKNLKDKSVEICTHGQEDIIELFLESLKKNSGLARIDSLSITVCEPKETFTSFNILH